MPPARNRFDWHKLAEENTVPVFLIRHGQTSWNKERRFLGRTDIPLDEEGKIQASQVALSLHNTPIAGLYSSPLSRAWETAEAISNRCSQPIHKVSALTELDQGELEGQCGDVLLDRYADFFQEWKHNPAHARVPGGETLTECQERASLAVHQILSQYEPGPPVVIVSHRMTIGCLICEAMNWPLTKNLDIEQRNTAVNLLGYRNGRLRVHVLNDASHLD